METVIRFILYSVLWAIDMWMYIIIFLALIVIVGNALLLLRTANKPKIPDSVKPHPYEDEDDSGW